MKMWTYEQLTGKLRNDDGSVIGVGYAGRGEGKNNPALQAVKDTGPLPCGMYTITPPADDPVVGRFALRLIPAATDELYNRNDFFIHGDNPAHIGQSSDGCIVMALDVRQEVWASNDRILQVVSGKFNFDSDQITSV